MSRERYRTKQKDIILNYLKENEGKHVKVQDIYNGLKNSGNGIGVSTIYRYLDRLIEEGEIKKYLLDGNAAACYQYGTEDMSEQEYHLRCVKCGGLFHFQSEDIDHLSNEMKNKGMSVNLKDTVFSGECNTCNENYKKDIGELQ